MSDVHEKAAAFRSSVSETNPMCIYMVTSDSKGDKLLFRYPFRSFTEPVKLSVIDQKRSLHRDATLTPDKTVRPEELTNFTDDVIANLFAVKMELCDRKFELKVNNVRFIGHPMLIETGGFSFKKKSSPILIHIVFALDAFARRQIVNCYYDLSKVLAVALGHEENRCVYLSQQVKDILFIHDSMAIDSW